MNLYSKLKKADIFNIKTFLRLAQNSYNVISINREYVILQSHYEQILRAASRVNSAINRLKLDIKPIQVHVLDKFSQEVKYKYEGNTQIYKKQTPCYKIKIEGEIPVIKGWKIVGRATYNEGRNPIVTSFNEEEQIPPNFWTKGPVCEHCNQKRNRINVYILKNISTGEYKQVGSACLSVFTGLPNPEKIAEHANAFNVFITIVNQSASELDEDQIMSKALGILRDIKAEDAMNLSLLEILTLCAAYIRKHGYISVKESEKYDMVSTKEVLIEMIYTDKIHQLARLVTQEDEATAIEALDWIYQFDIFDFTLNDYMRNLINAVQQNEINNYNFGLLVSLIPTYLKHKKQKQDQEIIEKNINKTEDELYIGKVGETVSIEEATVDDVFVSDKYRYTTYFVNMTTKDGKKIKYIGSIDKFQKGYSYNFTAKIKECVPADPNRAYDKFAYTLIERPKDINKAETEENKRREQLAKDNEIRRKLGGDLGLYLSREMKALINSIPELKEISNYNYQQKSKVDCDEISKKYSSYVTFDDDIFMDLIWEVINEKKIDPIMLYKYTIEEFEEQIIKQIKSDSRLLQLIKEFLLLTELIRRDSTPVEQRYEAILTIIESYIENFKETIKSSKNKHKFYKLSQNQFNNYNQNAQTQSNWFKQITQPYNYNINSQYLPSGQKLQQQKLQQQKLQQQKLQQQKLQQQKLQQQKLQQQKLQQQKLQQQKLQQQKLQQQKLQQQKLQQQKLQQQKLQQQKSQNKKPKKYVFEATGYCPCKTCTSGSNRTFSGTIPKEGRTVAVPPSIQLGTPLKIYGVENFGLDNNFIAEDRGGNIKGFRIDIFFNNHKKALQFGRRKVVVELPEWHKSLV